jgi:hypothetical protein
MVKPWHAKYLPHAGKSSTVVIIKNFETEKVTKNVMRINVGYVGGFTGYKFWGQIFLKHVQHKFLFKWTNSK